MIGAPAAAAGRALAHGLAWTGCAALVLAAAQPIFTDDLWWHLALGRAYAAAGPWLADDPLLFAPAGAPSPASWLADLLLHGVVEVAGFQGLRVLHAATVAGILALVWSIARRASGSGLVASGVALAFAGLGAYRLVQLRPELATLALALVFHRVAIESGDVPPWRRVGLLALLSALWANLHAGFLLGPMGLGAGALGAGVAAALDPAARWTRAMRLAAAAALSLLATALNPIGVRAHLAYFAAGDATPPLELVSDEWARFPLFELPTATLPPSPFSWLLVWTLGLALALSLPQIRRTRAADPALAGVALLGLAMALGAVRFLWLALLPLLWFVRLWRKPLSSVGARSASAWAAAALAAPALAGFFRAGDWPTITRGLPGEPAEFARPYRPAKYCGHAIWLIRDAGLEGNLYTEYFAGGFANYWLAPELRTLVNGTLNVSRDTFLAFGAIADRWRTRPDERFPELLDRIGLDLFLGMRPPAAAASPRPTASTTAHLERTPGWIPVYRSPVCSLYLRANERNRANADRLARHFAARGLPFDPVLGLPAATLLEAAPGWAAANGVVPQDFARLEHAAHHGGGERRAAAQRVAALYATLGLYERAIALDRETLRAWPDALRARRRLVWSLLRLRRFDEAAREAAILAARPPSDALSRRIARVARRAPTLDPDVADRAIARLPVLAANETGWLKRGLAAPELRPPR